MEETEWISLCPDLVTEYENNRHWSLQVLTVSVLRTRLLARKVRLLLLWGL